MIESFPSTLQAILDLANKAEVETWQLHGASDKPRQLQSLRLDKLSLFDDDALSGNKLFKLLPNFWFYQSLGYRALASFGGVYSNHLWSLAAAARHFGFSSQGFVNGQRGEQLSPTLVDARDAGMSLHFLPRRHFRHACWLDSSLSTQGMSSAYQTNTNLSHPDQFADHEFVSRAHIDKFNTLLEPGAAVLALGACNGLGVLGGFILGTVLQERYGEFDWLCASGSGTLATGLAMARQPSVGNFAGTQSGRVIAVSIFDTAEVAASRRANLHKLALHVVDQHQEIVDALLDQAIPLPAIDAAACDFIGLKAGDDGQLGRPELSVSKLIDGRASQIPLEPIYMAPTLRVYLDQCNKASPERPLLFIHGGGMQGVRK